MRLVFMGTPAFAVPSLKALVERHEVVGVLTRPDAVSGRGSRLRPSPVKQFAGSMSIPVFEPSTLRDPAAIGLLRDLAPEAIVVAAYGLLLPPEVLAIPALGCINVHASLLPRWRGAAPIQWSILAGDTQTGVSIMRMEEGMDTGPYCRTACTNVAEKNTSALTAELAELGAVTLVEALDDIAQGSCVWIEQHEASATHAPKVGKHDVALDPQQSAVQLSRRVRASSEQAPSRATIAGRPVTVLELEVATAALEAGTLAVDRDGVVGGCADGSVRFLRIKPDGKREMAAADWTRGLRLTTGERWGVSS